MQTELASVRVSLKTSRLTPTPYHNRTVVSLTLAKSKVQRSRENATSFIFSVLKKRGTEAVTETPPAGSERNAQEPVVKPFAKKTRQKWLD